MNNSTSSEQGNLPGPSTSTSSSHLLHGNEDGSTTDKPEEPSISFLSAMQLQVFKNFVNNYLTKGELLREDAIALQSMFGPTIIQVFEMIEEEQLVIHQSQTSKQIIIEVFGQTSSESYWIPAGHSICQCMHFVHGKSPFCKHVLAAHLYLAITPKEQFKVISDEQFMLLIRDLDDD
ncbi:unnamed protein product [Orchesella dallaii]|uniref:SWIM-type domain-containing protein n=1 Tax=Orchesella dallaii TaxID=48710 RepID=A0ABP1RBQ1_9HEXA